MIEKINSLINLGIYKNYKPETDLQEFKRYNLFYGWNGSGKTTISKLFRILEKKEIPQEYNSVKFNVEIDNVKVNEKSIESINEKIYVFNQDFIRENIDWDEKINKILLISKDKIEDVKKLKELKAEIEGNKEEKTQGLKEKVKIEKEKTDKLFKDIASANVRMAKNIKENFSTIDSLDKNYASYNKTNIQKIIENKELLNQILNNKFDEKEVETLKLSAKTEKQEKIEHNSIKINIDNFNTIKTKIEDLLKKSITATVIGRLKDNNDISKWVEEGLELNKKYSNTICEFCGSNITSERLEKLEAHFNDEVNKLKLDLKEQSEGIKQFVIEEKNIIVEKNLFYKENFTHIETLNINLKDKIAKCNKIIETIESKINDKLENLFSVFNLKDIDNYNDIFNDYNKQIELQQQYILSANAKTENFEKQINETKQKLEKYYLKEQFLSEDILEKIKEYENISKATNSLSVELNGKEQELTKLENQLSEETLGAENFNIKLNVFIGYDELSLVFNKDLKGYEIIRKSTKQKAEHLSEGEKTAIAYIYFLTKLKENDNEIKDSIIVIDDPISSFDNNKLFNTYASIKTEFNGCKQLFILTHNFNFFKLIRDWITRKKDEDEKETCFSIYKVEPCIVNSSREGKIQNAGRTLNQTSEYDYIFSCVYKLKDEELDQDTLFSCGNASRKLLEAFLSFKFPKQRGDIQSLMDKAFSKTEEVQIKTKIYNFINAYSHLNVIETSGDLDVDTLLAESKGIVNVILNKIEELDKEHYVAMVHNSTSTKIIS